MKELLQQALDKWGVDSQLDMAIEECSELIIAIQHYRRGRVTIDAIIEECADVELMLEQMKLINKDYLFLWETWRAKKLRRLKELLTPQLT